MQAFDARLIITLKKGVLDPQGQATAGALAGLGFEGVESVRQGKVIDVEFRANSAEEARRVLIEMCDRLLANTVIEDYSVAEIQPKQSAGAQ